MSADEHQSPPISFTPAAPLRVAVLISGGGSTLANLIERINDGRLRNVLIVGVISSRRQVHGVEIARAAGLALQIIRPRDFPDSNAFAAAIRAALLDLSPHLVLLAGYLNLLPIPPEFRGRILNIHPALLPDFGGPGMYGLRVHQAVIDARARHTGCTVHIVDDHFDHGPIVAQARTVVLSDDTPEALSARVASLERDLYPAVLQSIADRGLPWLDRFSRQSNAVKTTPLTDRAPLDQSSDRTSTSGNPPPPTASKSYVCAICDRRVEYQGRLPALYPFCSSRCRWVDLGRWFKGQYSIDEDIPPEDLPADASFE